MKLVEQLELPFSIQGKYVAELKGSYRDRLAALLSQDLDFHRRSSAYGSHSFHSFPAKFPPQLPRKFIDGLTAASDVVLDPMAGSGTTIVEAFLAVLGCAWGSWLPCSSLAERKEPCRSSSCKFDGRPG